MQSDESFVIPERWNWRIQDSKPDNRETWRTGSFFHGVQPQPPGDHGSYRRAPRPFRLVGSSSDKGGDPKRRYGNSERAAEDCDGAQRTPPLSAAQLAVRFSRLAVRVARTH